MTKLKYFLGLLLLCSIYSASGQTNCSQQNLIGRWRQVESIPGVHTNVDSLKGIVTQSSKTIGVLDLRTDGTYEYSFLDVTDKKNRQYSFDEMTCEIILGTKKYARKNSNLKIVYLDNQFLIFSEDNNPKGVVTHLTVKIGGAQ